VAGDTQPGLLAVKQSESGDTLAEAEAAPGAQEGAAAFPLSKKAKRRAKRDLARAEVEKKWDEWQAGKDALGQEVGALYATAELDEKPAREGREGGDRRSPTHAGCGREEGGGRGREGKALWLAESEADLGSLPVAELRRALRAYGVDEDAPRDALVAKLRRCMLGA